MLGPLGKLFDSNEKEVKKLAPLISEINSLDEKTKKLKDSDFPKKTAELKKRIADGESVQNILPEAFALAREAAFRAIGQKHYDVQLMSAASLALGKISEQKTGEGKTLSAVPALYAHALTGKSVHLVTVNDYLARRDAGWMGPVFKLLGMSVSSIINDQQFIYDHEYSNPEARDFRLVHLKPITRKEAYQADVVYGINSEFGFDYLRDNMALSLDEIRQRGYYFAVVDEVDSVLIDEARTPHIISAPDETPSDKYYDYAKAVDKLSPDDYAVDEKLRTAHLTEQGLEKVERMYGVQNIYEKDFDTVYHIEAALKARTLFHKEKDYIVRDGEVILVDEFTGRLMEGRRLSDGLHQAIEAKEKVAIQKESKTLATVSLQNYFRMYEILSGMTGTAVTEAEEFNKIYKLDVVVIPTHRDVQRIDEPDAIYKTGRAKYNAVVKAVAEAHKTGQPVLVGTTSIDKNELLSDLLRRKGIKHEVLNAKNHVREAEIIARAGEKGAVTVATNMAGRGVDIILGGEAPVNEDGTDRKGTPEWEKWKKAHDEVLALGGLYVIGTERHESRRIDNQLRGRSGRQGDPGRSRFFVGLDDDIMRLFGGDNIAGLMTRFNMPEEVPLEHPIVSRAIEQAQGKVEGFNFDSRKHLVEQDEVLNKQRQIIYARRRELLESTDKDAEGMKNQIKDSIAESISMFVDSAESNPDVNPVERMIEDFSSIINIDDASKDLIRKQLESTPDISGREKIFKDHAFNVYEAREKQLGKDNMRILENEVTLKVVDSMWTEHLDTVENLRQGIGLRAYGQKDPLVEYKNEAFRMFENLMNGINDEIVHRIFKMQLVIEHNHNHDHEHNHEIDEPAGGALGLDEVSQGDSRTPSAAKVRKMMTNASSTQISNFSEKKIKTAKSASGGKKLGRNDLCWCGSGKKYKKCHYPN